MIIGAAQARESRARFYDPTTGQFLSRDPLEAITRSAYGYAYDNPVNLTDPTGLCSCGGGSWWASATSFARNNYGTIAQVVAGVGCLAVTAGTCAVFIAAGTGFKLLQDAEHYDGTELYAHAGGDAALGVFGIWFAATGAALAASAGALEDPVLAEQLYPAAADWSLRGLGAAGAIPDGIELGRAVSESEC